MEIRSTRTALGAFNHLFRGRNDFLSRLSPLTGSVFGYDAVSLFAPAEQTSEIKMEHEARANTSAGEIRRRRRMLVFSGQNRENCARLKTWMEGKSFKGDSCLSRTKIGLWIIPSSLFSLIWYHAMIHSQKWKVPRILWPKEGRKRE